MGDWFQTLADIDASIEEANIVAARIRSWLIESQVIEPSPRDCVFGGMGYPPLNYEQVVDGPAYSQHFRKLKTNGLQIKIGRTVFLNGQSGVTVTCPKCNAPCKNSWANAIDEWYKSTGPGTLKCLECGNEQSVTEWTFIPAWGFGNLGFTFWNWPPLKQSFINEMKRRIAHRTVFIADKL